MGNTKEANRTAWQLVMNFRTLRTGMIKKPDMRYNVNKLAYKFARDIIMDVDTSEILKKQKGRKIRLANKCNNILSNPIVQDWRNNKKSIKSINNERINFGQINHWAKDEKDIKILEVLKKHL